MPYLILGATGFGLYTLFDSQSGLFLPFSTGSYWMRPRKCSCPRRCSVWHMAKASTSCAAMCSNSRRLSSGRAPAEEAAVPSQSILAHCLATYGPEARVRLNETYRLNQELCQLPSQLWYQGDLRPAPAQATARLAHPPSVRSLISLMPFSRLSARPRWSWPTTPSTPSVRCWKSTLWPLWPRVSCSTTASPPTAWPFWPRIAPRTAPLPSVWRNCWHQRGAAPVLPVIDTVERLQGAERDVVLFSVTTSDPDHRDSPFLNNPNRFNVAITRARHKLVVVGSQAFFTQVPHTDAALQAHQASPPITTCVPTRERCLPGPSAWRVRRQWKNSGRPGAISCTRGRADHRS